jgi:serine phosphatase RsbU (regulator of sigma subunit)/integral membrane sensor domain MASE1
LWLVLVVVVTAYSAGASLAFLGFGAPSIVVLFLPAGVTLSALVLSPRRRWPWILAAVAVTEVVVDVSHGLSPRWAWGFALANTTEPLVGALLLRRYVPAQVNLLRRRDVLAFLGCCVGAGPVVGGLIGATTLALSVGLPWPQSFLSFWAGDAAGVLTIGGCVLAWRHGGGGRPVVTRAALAAVLAAAVTVIGFWPQQVPLFYLPIPVLFWLAFSQPLTVVLTAGAATTVTANLMTSTGHGPWAALDTSTQLITVTLQVFLTTTILGAWALAMGVAERDRARRDTSVERAARLRLDALQNLTADLARAATSTAIAEAIVREGVGLLADHGTAALVAPDQDELTVWMTSGWPGELAERFRRIPLDAPTLQAHVVRTGRPVVHQTHTDLVAAYPHLADVYRTLDIGSILAVPIRDGDGAPLGTLAFGFHREHGVDADVITFANTLASLSAQALRRAQAYERELGAAHQLQQALLPVLSDGLSGVRASATYRPADLTHDVGGDWYDIFPLPGGRIGFAVGDVVGHDLTAAAAMARLQSALRVIAQTTPDPARLLDDFDRASVLITDSGMTTVGFADYDPATRLLRYACAGHLPPLLVTDVGAEYLWEGRSMPIGLGQTGRPQGERLVPDGSALVWYTDGLVERHDEPMMTVMQRLAAAAGDLGPRDPEALCRHLLHHIVGTQALGDDTAILCVQFSDPRTTAQRRPPM